MKVAVGISIYPLILEMTDLQEILEAILVEDIGFKHIELHSEYLDRYIDTFLKLLENTGVSYTMHVPHDATKKIKVKLCSSLKKDIEFGDFWLKKSIGFAKDLGIKLLTIHPDRPVKATKRDAMKILCDHISLALDNMDCDMRLLLENMPADNYTISTPEVMKEFIKSVGSRQLGCTWDVTHSKLAIGERFLEFPRINKNHIKHVHLCDIRGRRDHFPLGTGKLNLSHVIESLKQIKYSGIINLEIVTKNPEELIRSKTAVEQLL